MKTETLALMISNVEKSYPKDADYVAVAREELAAIEKENAVMRETLNDLNDLAKSAGWGYMSDERGLAAGKIEAAISSEPT